MQLRLSVEKPIAQAYFKNFQNPKLEWKDINTLPRRVKINTNLRIIWYILLHNILSFALFAWISLKTQFIFFILNAQKMKFSIKDFFSKCDQIRKKSRIWSQLL